MPCTIQGRSSSHGAVSAHNTGDRACGPPVIELWRSSPCRLQIRLRHTIGSVSTEQLTTAKAQSRLSSRLSSRRVSHCLNTGTKCDSMIVTLCLANTTSSDSSSSDLQAQIIRANQRELICPKQYLLVQSRLWSF